MSFLQRYFIMRHGETEANAAGQIQGSSDFSSLTEKGRAQAASAGALVFGGNAPEISGDIHPVVVDAAYRSPLQRAEETLSILRKNAPPGSIPPTETVLPILTGIQLYDWEGRNVQDLEQQEPEAFHAWVSGDAFTISGRRPISEIWERAKRVWDYFQQEQGSTTIIVCHGSLSQALLCTAFGLDETHFRKFDFDNCAMVELQWQIGSQRAECWRWRFPEPSEWSPSLLVLSYTIGKDEVRNILEQQEPEASRVEQNVEKMNDTK